MTLQYFDGCPNWKTTASNIRSLLADHRIVADVEYQLIDTQQAAEVHRFRGSPTVLIDGADPFADPEAPFGLSCRVYLTPRGLAALPSKEQLLDALQGITGQPS